MSEQVFTNCLISLWLTQTIDQKISFAHPYYWIGLDK